MTRYDIIPGIHADIDRLTQTLSALGYVEGGNAWAHPEGRIAAFLGDFIDMGRANRAVLNLVRAMCAQGYAVAIMGNHELNALLYHQPGRNAEGTGDGFMRAHSAKNRAQHQTFLDEFPVGHPETAATPIEGETAFRAYGAGAKPVFFGHYKRLGPPAVDAPNAACLDYPQAACAYRWAGEARLDPENLIVVDQGLLALKGAHGTR